MPAVQHPSRTNDTKSAPRICSRFQDRKETISNLTYADKVILVATSSEELQDLVSRAEKAAKHDTMIINAAKTNVLQTLERYWMP